MERPKGKISIKEIILCSHKCIIEDLSNSEGQVKVYRNVHPIDGDTMKNISLLRLKSCLPSVCFDLLPKTANTNQPHTSIEHPLFPFVAIYVQCCQKRIWFLSGFHVAYPRLSICVHAEEIRGMCTRRYTFTGGL